MITEFENYLSSIKGYSVNTTIAYSKDVRSLARFMRAQHKGARWSTLTQADIDQYVTYMANTKHTAATISRHLASISAFYDYLKRSGKDVTNPARFESRPKVGQSIPNTIPTWARKELLLRTSGKMRSIIAIMMYTGARVQEVLDIRISDIHAEDSSITLQGKGNKQRNVYITDDLRPFLSEVSSDKKYKPFAGISQREVRWAMYNALSDHVEIAQKSPHALRHTYATELARQGANVTMIAKLLGHQSIKTTQKYIDMTDATTSSVGHNFKYN